MYRIEQQLDYLHTNSIPMSVRTQTDVEALEQADRDLEQLIEATQAVDWSVVSEVPVDDVAKWNEKLQYARKCVQADLEDVTNSL